MQYKSIEFTPKIEPSTTELLSMIYTPGVGGACLKIKDDKQESYTYTNRSNTVAVIAFDYTSALKRAIFLKNTLNIDALPLEVDKTKLQLVVENITPNFCGIDLVLIKDSLQNINFKSDIPILTESSCNIEETFKPVSKNIFNFNPNNLEGDFNEKSLHLRATAGGVVETDLSEEILPKPIAIVTDGTAVLGFGDIGPEAGLPVMEGKAVLFKALGNVDAVSLCLNTKNTAEIIEVVKALENSFSGINLEDISAPRCFEIEQTLIEELHIPIFHDDQHGTAIVVLAGILNSVSLAQKELSETKIIISGAGAAAQAVSKLLLNAGAKNIIHTDSKGVIYKNRPQNDEFKEKLAQITNPENIQGDLKSAIKGADIFIGLSTANILSGEDVKQMNSKPIIFALANPTPEIMPDVALENGAFIVATGRSDFDNQINNCIAFPGLFRGLLTHNISKITDKIKLECAIALASLIKDEDLTPQNILPKALDLSAPATIVQHLYNFRGQ